MSSVMRAASVLLLLLSLACGPSDPLAEIRELHENERFEETVDPLRKIVDNNPLQAEAKLLLGRALLQTGNAGLAVWPLRSASETPQYAVDAGLLLTQAMLESRTAPDAVEEIDRVLALEPDNVQAWMLRVEANQASGNLEEALEDIDRVLELEAGMLPVLITRVTVLLGLERIDEAAVALEAAQASFGESDSVAQPMLARLCVAHALFKHEKGDSDAAETLYADCTEKFPTEHVVVTQAVTFYDRVGKSERATEILARAAEMSDAGLFRTLLARRLGAHGDTDEEERLLRQEAEERPSGLSWFVLADYFVQQERWDEALEAFDRALATGPPASRLRFAYADTLVRAEQFEKARAVAKKLEHPELRNLIRGRILLGEGNARAALAAFESGISLWPNNAVGRFLAGQAAERVGDFPRAVSHYRESFRASPGDTEAGRALSELYAAQGEFEGALGIAGRYIQHHAADPEAYLLSIRLGHAMGRQQIVTEGLQRLALLPGQAAVAVAERASLRVSGTPDLGGAEQAVEVVEASGLDLTDPANAIALRILIEQMSRQGRHEKAGEVLDQALAAHPDEVIFHELRGGVLHAAGNAEQARADYERALELDSESWRALAGLGALAAEAGDATQALAFYDRAIAADPDVPQPARAAVALVRESDPEDAVRRLEALLDAHPRAARAANELAEIFADRGTLDRAAAYASRAAWFRLPAARATLARIRTLRGGAPAEPEPAVPNEPGQPNE